MWSPSPATAVAATVFQPRPEEWYLLPFQRRFQPDYNIGTMTEEQTRIPMTLPSSFYPLIDQAINYQLDNRITDDIRYAAYLAYTNLAIPGTYTEIATLQITT